MESVFCTDYNAGIFPLTLVTVCDLGCDPVGDPVRDLVIPNCVSPKLRARLVFTIKQRHLTLLDHSAPSDVCSMYSLISCDVISSTYMWVTRRHGAPWRVERCHGTLCSVRTHHIHLVRC